MLHGRPNEWTAMIAEQLSSYTCSISAIPIQNVSLLTSAMTGFKFAICTADKTAGQQIEGIMTLLFGGRLADNKARTIEYVPLFVKKTKSRLK